MTDDNNKCLSRGHMYQCQLPNETLEDVPEVPDDPDGDPDV